MSLELDLVSQVMNLRDGEVNPGDKAKVERFESKMSDQKHDVIGDSKNFTREEMSFESREQLRRVLV
jgi:acylphosphatase